MRYYGQVFGKKRLLYLGFNCWSLPSLSKDDIAMIEMLILISSSILTWVLRWYGFDVENERNWPQLEPIFPRFLRRRSFHLFYPWLQEWYVQCPSLWGSLKPQCLKRQHRWWSHHKSSPLKKLWFIPILVSIFTWWQIPRTKTIIHTYFAWMMWTRNDQFAVIKQEELYQNLRFYRFMLDFAYEPASEKRCGCYALGLPDAPPQKSVLLPLRSCEFQL